MHMLDPDRLFADSGKPCAAESAGESSVGGLPVELLEATILVTTPHSHHQSDDCHT